MHKKRTVHPGDSLYIVSDCFSTENGETSKKKKVIRLIIEKVIFDYKTEEISPTKEYYWTRKSLHKGYIKIVCRGTTNMQVKAFGVISGDQKINGFYDDLGCYNIYIKDQQVKSGTKQIVESEGIFYFASKYANVELKSFKKRLKIFTIYQHAAAEYYNNHYNK